MPWDPAQYLGFQDARTRPALELLARIPLETPRRIVDLGCGPGHLARLLQARWPGAEVTGVDDSAEMLARARTEVPGVAWIQADLAAWAPPGPVDLLFANASLHWLDGHAALLPRLLGYLAPGGCLAVQMPRNHDRPAHQAVLAVARTGPWAERLRPHLRPAPVATPEAYFRWLHPHAASLDVWEADYLQLLDGEDPVLAWLQGSFLVPLAGALTPVEAEAFLEACRTALRAAYPPEADGRTLFPFRRLFLVARR